MTYHLDILGRPPARKSELPKELEHESTGDWRGEEFIRTMRSAKRGPTGKTARVIERRKEVLAMFKAGRSPVEMMRKLGVTERTIYNDAHSMGLKFLPGRGKR